MANLPKEFERYLIPTESIVFSIRYHWLSLVKPFAMLFGWLFVIGLIDRALDGDGLILRDVAIWVWFGLLLWTAWKLLDWYKTVFVATDRRLVLVYGIIVRKVAIMPMSKVTDMRYDRTIAGQIFGYGTYILESAGQDQALTNVNYVPHPDLHYRQISQVLFGSGLNAKLGAEKPSRRLPITEPETSWWRR
jgi:hypothetical protein